MEKIYLKTKLAIGSLWIKRLVFVGEAASYIDAAIKTEANETKSEEVKETDMFAAAQAAIEITKPDQNEKNKNTPEAIKYDAALKDLEASKAKFKTAEANIKKKLTLTAELAGLDFTNDFVAASKKFESLKKQSDELEKASTLYKVGYGLMKNRMDRAKATYYSGVEKVDGILNKDNKVPEENIKSIENFRGYMSKLSQLQAIVSADFPGCTDEEKTAKKTEYQAKIDGIAEWLEANKKAEGIPADERTAFERLSFARTNLAGAERDKDPGHMAGAKEYMDMVTAEQDARRIWNMLPVDASVGGNWREKDMQKPANWGQGYEKEKRFYDDAVTAFNSGVSKSGRAENPKYAEATKDFSAAKEGFQKVLDVYNQKVKEDAEKSAAETVDVAEGLKISSFNTGLDNVNKAVLRIKGLPDSLFTKQVKPLLDRFSVNDVYKGNIDAKIKKVEGLAAQINDIAQSYQDGLGQISRAVGGAVAQNVKEDNYLDSSKAAIFANYLNDPSLWAAMKSEIKSILQGQVDISGDYTIGTTVYHYSKRGSGPVEVKAKPSGSYAGSLSVRYSGTEVDTSATAGEYLKMKLPVDKPLPKASSSPEAKPTA